ncbi:MAG TPA: PQQ-dependent sugar dehydrogenase [Longimicrobium sp.]
MNRIQNTLLPLALAALAACGDGAGDVATEQQPGTPAAPTPPASTPACSPGNGGIQLPAGFCAVVVADSLGGVRHLAVAPNGDVYAAVSTPRNGGGGVIALRDADGDGRAEMKREIAVPPGSGIAISGGYLYFAPNDGVLRWRMAEGQLVPAGQPETVVTGLPTGGHTAKTIALDGRGALYVNIGSRSNSCQVADRAPGSPGEDPCRELATRAGIWRFDAARAGQTQAQGTRFATGIRNAVGLAVAPDGKVYAAQHGRDQLNTIAPRLYSDAKNAENPAEELLQLAQGDDYGWPYCYFDTDLKRKTLAPEYGGNANEAGRCAAIKAPIATFPAHWAPMALAVYDGAQFPARFRNGTFVSFHGSWNRAPLPQAGFRVSFVPAGAPGGAYEDFATGFQTGGHRPMGLAVGPDGSLYIGDDAGGRIWRVIHTGAR